MFFFLSFFHAHDSHSMHGVSDSRTWAYRYTTPVMGELGLNKGLGVETRCLCSAGATSYAEYSIVQMLYSETKHESAPMQS